MTIDTGAPEVALWTPAGGLQTLTVTIAPNLDAFETSSMKW